MKKYLFLLGLLPFLLPVGNALAIGQYLETCTATTSYGYITASPNDSPSIGASGSYQPCATIDNSGNASRNYISIPAQVTVTAIPNGLNTFSYWMGAESECVWRKPGINAVNPSRPPDDWKLVSVSGSGFLKCSRGLNTGGIGIDLRQAPRI